MTAPLADAEARRKIREDLDTTFFVEAAAGTGKTTALVSRIIAVLRRGRSTLDRLVAVTFTEKAAGEMKLRLREAIETSRSDAACGADEKARFEAALGHLEAARIGTIHAFCADLLHERPVEARVDPMFEVGAEDESSVLLDEAFDSWFERTLADPPPGVRRVLRRPRRGPDDRGPRASLRAAVGALVEHRDFPAAWRRDPAFGRDAAIDDIMEELAALAPLADRARRRDDWLAKNLRNIGAFVHETEVRESVVGRDHDGLEVALRSLLKRGGRAKAGWAWKGAGTYAPDLSRDEVIARRDAVRVELEMFVEAADADLAAALREDLRPVVDAYEALKEREGRLDFLDLLVRARDLVRDDASVRAELQERYTHYFVDEFQDTDPLQAEILLLLAADDADVTDPALARPHPGKLFVVGDPKQSIYRFRRADVALYERTKRRLIGSGAEVLHLATSFRGVPGIQAAVNGAFAPLMTGDEESAQARYVALEPHRPELPDQPAVVVLPVPRPYGRYGKITNYAIDESLPGAAGAFVHWLVTQSGWSVTDRDDPATPVPVQPRHVCILFRRFRRFFDDVTRPYVQALEAHRLPHVLVGGHSFHDREEVLALRNALVAIEWPDDALRVFATLRGPFFALADDALLAYRHGVGTLHPLRRLAEAERDALGEPEREVADALEILAQLHARRNRRPVAETLGRLLDAVRAHAGIAIWPTGEQALANCLRVIDRARRFERRGASSFRAFVELLEDEAARGEGAEAPVVEEGTEGVRMMTVHRAKGLEFPVVVLVDPTCRATREVPSHHVDAARGLWAGSLCGAAPHDLLDARGIEAQRESAEAIRLTYVATTRARDLLVVPGVGDERIDGWLESLEPAVHPPHAARRDATAAPGCPAFGDDSVFDRSDDGPRGATASVRPGRHVTEAGNTVVWWEPAALELQPPERVGLRRMELLQSDADTAAADEGIRAHDAWRARRGAVVETSAAAAVTVSVATAYATARAVAGPPIAWEEVEDPRRAARPGGKRFGTLVHAVLAIVSVTADEGDVRAAVEGQGRLIGATDHELDAAGAVVVRALADPRVMGARAAEEVRRETPLLVRIEDGTIVEGTVDLAYREMTAEGPAWTVVDFKTDRAIDDERRGIYEGQVRLYVQAIRQATGESAEGVLLVV